MVDTVRIKAIREAQNLLWAARRAGGNFEALERVWVALNHAKDEAQNPGDFAAVSHV